MSTLPATPRPTRPVTPQTMRWALSLTSVLGLLVGCSSVSLDLSSASKRHQSTAASTPGQASMPEPASDLPNLGAASLPDFQPSSAGAAPSGNAATAVRAKSYSSATTPKDYRKDAAQHLYIQNAHRIYKGRMPPLLYAVGVLDVEVDEQGQVLSTHWKRAPNHAPEVITEIERTVQQAAPFPRPARMGRVTYTDVWLWDKGGQFQLDTLTEGQD